MDYYQILGIERTATQDDIKKAFHKLAHKYHPDKGGDEKKFKEINEAYQVLSNAEKRSQYDQFGRVFEGAGGPSAGSAQDFNWAWQNSSQNFDFDDLGDIFENFFSFGGGGARRASRKDARKGKDIQIDIEISLEETLSQVTKEVALHKMVFCQRCHGKGAEPGTKINECFSCRGTGQVQQVKRTMLGSYTAFATCPECHGEGSKPEKPCNVCKGEGRVKGQEIVQINIPAGVDNNQAIEIDGKGESGKRGARAGNLYARIFIKKHPVFKRKGDDLIIFQEIAYSQAILGDEIEIPTLEGKAIILKVPQGTESGKVLRISSRGIPHFGGYGRGDIYVELNIKTPKKITREQKKLLDEMRKQGL